VLRFDPPATHSKRGTSITDRQEQLENHLDHFIRRIPFFQLYGSPIFLLLLQRGFLLEALRTTIFELFDPPLYFLLRCRHPPSLQALGAAEARSHGGEADYEEEEDEEEEEDAGDGVDDGGGGRVGDFVLGHRLPRRPPPTCLLTAP